MPVLRAFVSILTARFVLPIAARVALGFIAAVIAIAVAGALHREIPPIFVLAIMLATATSVYGLTTHSISVWLGFVFRGTH